MLSLGLDSTSGDGLDLHFRETATAPRLVLTLSAPGADAGTAPAPAPASAPVASFTVSAVSGPAPFEVAFTDTSTGSPTSWQWQFGDGGSSTQQNPTHTFHIAGYYLVTLFVPNGSGAPSTAVQSVTVEVPSPGPDRPTASFTASPESGNWPLRVSFTDTSTNSPSSWEWSFADGSTSTERNPTHTFATAASYPVRLVASNADGASEPVTRWIIVREPPTRGEIIVQRSSTAVSLSSTAVDVPRPAGLADGDVLIASINADDAPSMGAVPAGWSPVIDPLSMVSSARLFAFYRVVADASAEPSSYAWRLGRAVKWNAVMTSYSGVDSGTPFDTAASTAVQTSRGTSLAVPGVTTVTPGALLVGGIGSNTAGMNLNSASGWGESVKAGGGQVTSLAYQTRPTVGATGTARWSINPAEQAAGWLRGLRPAAG
jgi:PKD repeat protein